MSPKRGHFLELGTFGERRVRAYLPRGAEESQRKVVVMFDGQNVFGDEGSFAGGWRAHETVDRMRAGPVVLAIDHAGRGRIGELGTPDALITTIVDQVLPAAHAQLRLQYGPGAHFVCGSSMGGFAALYTHFRRPDVFGGAIAMSPSLWYAQRKIFDVQARQPNPYRSRIYLDAGAREAGGRLARIVGEMGEELRRRGLTVMLRIDPKGSHNEASWRRRLPKALRFILAS